MKKITLLSAILISFSVFATTRNVPGTYATIQAGLNACLNGDTVLVQPGTYTQNIVWPNLANIKLFSAGDTSNTIINGGGVATVITISVNTDTNTIIKGFKITNGYGNTTFTNAGGVQVQSGGVKFLNCLISNNNPGGGSTLYAYGAGAYVGGTNSVFDNVVFRNNNSSSGGYGFGGAMYIPTNTTVRMRNCIARSNLVTAANYCWGGGINSEGNLILSNSTIENNSTSSGGYNFGGGIAITAGTATITNVKIINNTLGGTPNFIWGGGLYTDGASTTNLTNVLIAGNILSNSSFVNGGGGIHIEGANTSLIAIQITVSENRRANNGTITGSGLQVETSASATINNSIFWNTNGGAEIDNNSSTVTINYSDVRGGFFGIGDINTNAMFVSTTDFHLQMTSPCAGVGTLSGAPNYDLDNNMRPMPALTNPDMGCYEVSQLVGIAENNLEHNFSVYPNPASDNLFVIMSEAKNLILYNSLGEEVSNWNLSAGTNEINISDLSSGIYFLELKTESGVVMKKIIKE